MKSHPVIGVLMGGCSSEREVSLRSGAAVADALKSIGHKVVPIDLQSEDLRELEGVHLDVAFIALHGRFGEDGRLQQLLQKRGIPYTGSGPGASRAAMDKVEAKRLFKLKHVETPPHRVIARGDSVDLMEHAARALGYPVVMKPRAEGSSVGVTVHEDRATLLDGAAECFRHDPIGLMEKFIQGRELTVGILDGKALPVIELRPKSRFFDYKAKYQDPDTQYIVNPGAQRSGPSARAESRQGRARRAGLRGHEPRRHHPHAVLLRPRARGQHHPGPDGPEPLPKAAGAAGSRSPCSAGGSPSWPSSGSRARSGRPPRCSRRDRSGYSLIRRTFTPFTTTTTESPFWIPISSRESRVITLDMLERGSPASPGT